MTQWTLTRHDSIFGINQIFYPLIDYPHGNFSVRAGFHLIKTQRIARPRFRVRILCFAGSYQAAFCSCTLIEISDLDEATLGRP